MTSRDLLEYELNQSGRQISVCLDGMSEAAMEAKCSPVGMTPREMVEHLCEAYVAFAKISADEKHEWGSFTVQDKSTKNLRAVFDDLRASAVHAALSNDDEAAQKSAYDYIVGHDNYHVSQLVLARLQAEPDWDSYAIYS